jgi:hypothetical protein
MNEYFDILDSLCDKYEFAAATMDGSISLDLSSEYESLSIYDDFSFIEN